MKLPRDVDAEQLIGALARLGYHAVRQSGSHIRLESASPAHAVTVPNHRPIRIGTLAAILGDVAEARRISKADLISLLFD